MGKKIYAKIYLDRDADDTPVLVFDSIKNTEGVSTVYFIKAGREKSFFDEYWHIVQHNKVIGLDGVAISPEAKSHFLARIEDTSSYGVREFTGDVTLCSLREIFSYMPDDLARAFADKIAIQDMPLVPNCGTERRLRADERFVFREKPDVRAFDKMIEADNAYLRDLDISAPVDANILYQMYFEKKRRGEGEPACDTETIKATPAAFLTEAQKDVIRADYKTRCSMYSAQEWNETRDYDHGEYLFSEVIVPALMNTYNKCFSEIENIINVYSKRY